MLDCFEREQVSISPCLHNVGFEAQSFLYHLARHVEHHAVYVDLGITVEMEQAMNAWARDGFRTEIRRLRKDPECKTLFLAISGKMASGKSTLSESIEKKGRYYLNKRVARVSTAWPLKEAAHQLFGMSLEEEKKDRPLLIELGNVVRKREENRLVNMAIQQARELGRFNDVVIIDDLRFQNEAPALKAAGFKLIRCEVSECIRKERILSKYPNTAEVHFSRMNSTSETQLDDYMSWDKVVDTSKPVTDSQVREIISLS